MEASKSDTESNSLVFENKPEVPDDVASDRESSVESFHTNISSIPTESDLIDVDEIELSDEETWLYKSPKKQIIKEKELSTYNWLQKDEECLDDLELLVAKKALVTKLNEIKRNNPDLDLSLKKTKVKETNSFDENCDTKRKPVIPTKDTPHTSAKNHGPIPASSSTNQTSLDHVDKKSTHTSADAKIEDGIVDVHAMARLQEESLRQSTSQFFNQTSYLSPIENSHGLKLSKPVSVEALHMYSGKQSPSSVLNILSPSCARKLNPFSSTMSLNHDNASYRGSLPNINNGYNSLRLKKVKCPNDQKIQCPLPIYPTKPKNSSYEIPDEASKNSLKNNPNSPQYDYRESRTLPSSYRMNSRNRSASRTSNSTLSSPRRESTPLFSHQRMDSSMTNSYRRESTPLLSPQRMDSSMTNSYRRDSLPCNGHRIMSPVSSPTQYRRNSLLKPSRVMSVSSLEMKASPQADQRLSHSPSRRMPLSTVLNQSPRCGRRSSSPMNGEARILKMPSKIPNPANRSAIPVPSSQYISKPNIEDESWSQEFF